MSDVAARRTRRRCLLLVLTAMLLATSIAEAGRPSIRIDLGAWGTNLGIDLATGASTCTFDTGVSGSPGEYLYG